MEDFFGLVGNQVEGRYAVEAVVAAGGFGVVYRASHTALGLSFALKVLRVPANLPPQLHGTFTAQFLGEAKIISALQHPAIVRVTDYGVIAFDDGAQAPWMALEWIDGITLAKDLDARRGHGGRSPRACLELLTPVLEALALAHAKGIAHRDIKPANLMLPSLEPALPGVTGLRASRHSGPRLRILDFGIAKVLDEQEGTVSGLTQTGSTMAAFSPRYAAPEQASGTRTGPWTDVHALGLLLTEMLVDQPAYRLGDKMELQIQVMASRRPTPATFGVDVGPWERILARALALRPAERFANAGELLAALEAEVPEARAVTPASATTEPVPLFPPVPGPEMTVSTTAAASVEVTALPAAPTSRGWWAVGALVGVLGAVAVLRGVTTARPPTVRAADRSLATVAARPDASTDASSAGPSVESVALDADLVFAAPVDASEPDGPVPADADAPARVVRRIPRTPADLRRPLRPGVGTGRRHNPWE